MVSVRLLAISRKIFHVQFLTSLLMISGGSRSLAALAFPNREITMIGGWEAHGIDSGLYSRSLMKYASEASEKDPNPLNVLKSAHTMCSTIPGSSTACVITLSGNSLEAVNLGDSGFLVIRNGHL